MKATAFQLFHGQVLSLDTEITVKDLATLAALTTTFALISPSNLIASSGDITEKIAKSSQPIKDLLIGVADPVCYIVFVWGLLETMLGKGSSGLTRMKYAALGYLGMNWLPVLMDIIRNAKP